MVSEQEKFNNKWFLQLSYGSSNRTETDDRMMQAPDQRACTLNFCRITS